MACTENLDKMRWAIRLIVIQVILIIFLIKISAAADERNSSDKAGNKGVIFLTDTQKEIIREIMRVEKTVLLTIDELDLDNDHSNEAVVTYLFSAHSSGVKVIKFNKEKANILFERGCSTPNALFDIINNVPTISLQEADYEPDYVSSGRFWEVYQWDGHTFVCGVSRGRDVS